MKIFINRILNMKKIHVIGFDMDHTLVRYHTQNFESFAYYEAIKKLVSVKKYPEEILNLKFDFNLAIQGLVIDKTYGNLLKVSRFGKVKMASHGSSSLSHSVQKSLYGNKVIDLNEGHIQSLDTSFSISNGVLYSQLVELKKTCPEIPHYDILASDIRDAIDLSHKDGSLKSEVKENIDRYIIRDPDLPELLEFYKSSGKRLIIITNSDYPYTKLLLDYAINPFLKEHKSWDELFEITITLSSKPNFFYHPNHFLKVDPETALMSNISGKVSKGIYQGGWAGKLQEDLGCDEEQILYLGDHIYGDVVALKKTFNWRTALVLHPLEEEIDSIIKGKDVQKQIDELMAEKEKLEKGLSVSEVRSYHQNFSAEQRTEISNNREELDKINEKISSLLVKYRSFFNAQWGEIMRAGQEESRFADQVEKYACIYMTNISDLLENSPRSYFRPTRRVLPHERIEILENK